MVVPHDFLEALGKAGFELHADLNVFLRRDIPTFRVSVHDIFTGVWDGPTDLVKYLLKHKLIDEHGNAAWLGRTQ